MKTSSVWFGLCLRTDWIGLGWVQISQSKTSANYGSRPNRSISLSRRFHLQPNFRSSEAPSNFAAAAHTRCKTVHVRTYSTRRDMHVCLQNRSICLCAASLGVLALWRIQATSASNPTAAAAGRILSTVVSFDAMSDLDS